MKFVPPKNLRSYPTRNVDPKHTRTQNTKKRRNTTFGSRNLVKIRNYIPMNFPTYRIDNGNHMGNHRGNYYGSKMGNGMGNRVGNRMGNYR